MDSSNNIICWIGDNFLAIVVAICTFVYTIINYKMLIESRKTRKQKITPHIVAYLELTEINRKIFSLNIKNIGEGLAKDVSFNIIKDYALGDKVPLKERGAFSIGISSFAPNYTLTYVLGCTLNNQEDANSNNDYIELEVTYYDVTGEKYIDKYKLLFKEIVGQLYTNPPTAFKPALIHYLKNIAQQTQIIAEKILSAKDNITN